VANEGEYTVDPKTGVVTFNPDSSFSGPASPIKYIVKDSTDQVASATIAATVSSAPGPSYQLSYDLDGGTGTTPATVTGLNQGDTTTLANGTGFSKTGFTFAGWSCDNSIGTKAAGSTATQPAANVICTAQWATTTAQRSLAATGFDPHRGLQIVFFLLLAASVLLYSSQRVRRRWP
jgi:uncharacterized repeat protein (TIGR02543 family)